MPAPGRPGSLDPARERPASPRTRGRSVRTSPRRAQTPPRPRSRPPGGPSSVPFDRFTPSFQANRGPRYLALRRLDAVEDDVHIAELLAVKCKHVPDWEPVCDAIRDGSTLGLDVPSDERFGPRVQE